MNSVAFFEILKELDCLLQQYFEKEDFNEAIYQNITDIIHEHKILETKSKHKIVINLLANIIAYHRVGPNFSQKFEKIIEILDIFKTFSTNQIYKIFRFSRRSLFYFFQKKLIEPNDQIFKDIIKNNLHLFFSSIIPARLYGYKNCGNDIYMVLREQQPINQELFEIGENNQDPILSLIRKDSVEEFVAYVTRHNFNLKTKILPSVYETNLFLIDKNVSLIQYAAFFGSIQIFQYLMLNSIDLEPSLWEFAIHGQNPEIIHILERNIGLPEESSYQFLIKESIKCHCSNMANYFFNLKTDLIAESFYRIAYMYYSFEFFLQDMNYGYIFLFACDYEYFDIAKDIIQEKGFNPYAELIFYLFNIVSK